jgi:hypothetical protein
MRSKQTSGLYKVDPAVPNAKLEPGKISEMLLEFAAPLLQLGADGPPDIKVLGQLMMLTEMCWNLPVFETNDPAAHAHFKQDFDSNTPRQDELVTSALQEISNRCTTLVSRASPC